MRLRLLTPVIVAAALAATVPTQGPTTASRVPGTDQVQPVAATAARSGYTAWSGWGFTRGRGWGLAGNRGPLTIGARAGWTTLGGSTYRTGTWTSPWASPGFAFTQLIASWQVATPAGSWVDVYVRGRTAAGRVSSFDHVARWSTRDAGFRRTSFGWQGDDLGHMATDTFIANGRVRFTSWQVRIMLAKTPSGASPSLRRIGANAYLPGSVPATSAFSGVVRRLPVPAYSQMIHRGQYPRYGGGGEAWCSATTTSMLLGYFHALPSRANYAWVNSSYADPWVDHVARMVYDYGYQGTGNWPFNTGYAAQYLPDAFVTRLTSLRQAERFIAAGIPLGASIAFGPGQLTGAPISSTPGHLVVISGFTRYGSVVVNDPAAPNDSSVVRIYNRGQFERAWLRGSGGMVYVEHDAAHPLPRRTPGSAW